MRNSLYSFLVSLAVATSAYPQAAGRLTGSVVDPTGAAIAGAGISLSLAGSAQVLIEGRTSAEGLFSFPSLGANYYDLRVEQVGFVTTTLRRVKIDVGRETPLPPIRLEIAAVAESVEVTAGVDVVQTTSAEVANTVTNDQVRRLPLLDRSLTSLLLNQAGVSDGRGTVVVNGMRSSYANLSFEGINIQDNYLRNNTLTYQPNLLLLDQVGEFTVATANATAVAPGGGAQVVFTAPSGTNEYHGALYWYNRNNRMAAGDWFDNQAGIDKAFLNQNQVGGRLSGPIFKDKLLFFVNYEAYRNRQQSASTRTILTDSARRGEFVYADAAGNVRTANLLGLRNATIDPAIQSLLQALPSADRANSFLAGDSRPGFLRNTIGFSQQVRDNRDRNNLLAKADYIFSAKNALAVTYAYNTDLSDRPDASVDFTPVPPVVNKNHSHLVSAAWRSNPTATVVNELRGGFNLAPGDFLNSQPTPEYWIAGLSFTYPISNFEQQGRATDTYNLANTTSWFRGTHSLQFGYQQQLVRIAPYNYFGVLPTYTLGMGTGQRALTAAELPGIRAADLAGANGLLATLGGFIDAYDQSFNVNSRTSGFAPGTPQRRHYQLDNHALFVQDQWRLRRGLTVNLGLRWDYQTPMRERDSLLLMPVLRNNNFIETMLSDATLDFAGNGDTRELYRRDRNNFGPNIGIAWDPFGYGRTSIRAGYSVHFVNDYLVAAMENNVGATNDGLTAVVGEAGLSGRLSAGRPAVPVPVLKVPRTFADNYELDPTGAAAGMPDPGMVTPYVQQWNFGIQQEIKGAVFEIRYVGNKSTKQLRALDYNQIDFRAGGFYDDFLRARGNGFLARAAGRGFDPRFNSAIPGSQRTPVFDSFVGGGLLTNGAVAGLIETGEVSQLAHIYTQVGFAPFSFYRNEFIYGANVMTNFSNSSYHSLQIEARRRLRNGISFQTSYTFSKVLSDALGDGQVLFEPFLDFNNSKIERARAPFDLTHSWKANFIYELPFGAGRRFATSGAWSRIAGGWSVSGFLGWQSGTPFSVLSTRGTLNRSGTRSNSNTVNTTLNAHQLDDVVRFTMTGDGPRFIDARFVGPDGRGVAGDGAQFNGQVFFNPDPGSVGALQRRRFTGPTAFSFDGGIQKLTRVTERHSVEIRMEAKNILNHPAFYVGDETSAGSAARFNVNSTRFGLITQTFYDRRAIQFGLYWRF